MNVAVSVGKINTFSDTKIRKIINSLIQILLLVIVFVSVMVLLM